MPFDITYDDAVHGHYSDPDGNDQSGDTDESEESVVRSRPAGSGHLVFDGLDENGEPREDRARALTARRRVPTQPKDRNVQFTNAETAAERSKERRSSPPPKPSSRTWTRNPLQNQQDEWKSAQDAWTSAQNIWNASTKQDVTLHFEMDIAQDVESKLEEFSELKRLGQFHAAEQFYQDSLEPFSNFYPIAIEYADMLVEQGAYERLQQFMAEKKELLPSTEQDPEDNPLQGGEVNERFNLQLIAAYSAIHTHGRLKEAYDQVLSVGNAIRSMPGESLSAMVWEPPGVALYALKILFLVEQETDLVPEHCFDMWSNCCSLYKTLVVQDQIWDARDLIVALVESDRPVNTWQWIFNADIYSRDAFTQLYADWNVEEYDLSTYLAILDILVSTARGLTSLLPNEQDIQAAERCLQNACTVATCLKENNQQMVKSRPYMHWVLAEEDLQRMKLATEDRLKEEGFLGLKIMKGALPIYVPIKSENPTWWVMYGQSKQQSGTLLESTLQAAREIADYATEAWCLEQMISRSPEPPVELFAQLCHLQKTLMRDMFEYRRTCMSKFLLAEADYAQRELLDELKTIRGQRETSFVYSFSDWCESMIDKALCESLGIASNHDQADLNSFAPFLPQFMKDFLEEVGLDNIYGLDFKSDYRGKERT